MNRWRITTTGPNGQDTIEVGEISDLARTVGAAVVSGATDVRITAGDLVEDDGDRINLQLEPERLTRLVEVLKAAGAHPSGLGSYEAANDANVLAEDLATQAKTQGWSS